MSRRVMKGQCWTWTCVLSTIAVLVAGAAVAEEPPAAEAPAVEALLGETLTAESLTAESLGAALVGAELQELPPEPWQDPPPAEWRPGTPFVLRAALSERKMRIPDVTGKQRMEQRVYLRSYNDAGVGPTFRVKPGDSLRVRLINDLPKDTIGHDAHLGHLPDCKLPPYLNPTNLHTHGLHISPTAPSDDVTLTVMPGGGSYGYRFDILPAGNPPGEPPMTHYPGTMWYHAHLHGTTAPQLASGMAGALIVEGDIDEVPGIKGARERTFLFQQLAFDFYGELKSFADLGANWAGRNPPVTGPPKHTSINGVVVPGFTMRPGQVERWRWIHGGVFEMLPLVLVERGRNIPVPLHAVAFDGITLPQVQRWGGLELGPGYRADVMVKAPSKPGATYDLYKLPSSLQLTALDALGEDATASLDGAQLVAVVRVTGADCDRDPTCHSTLPTGALPAPLEPVRVVSPERRQVEFSFAAGPKFMINDRCYDPDEVHEDFRLTKGRNEEWILRNVTSGPHPFHIHVNAFQVMNPNGSFGPWKDTVIVPPMKDGKPGELRIRTRIERFTGRFVLHCHILTHEDQGMMQLVEVRDRWPSAEEAAADPAAVGSGSEMP